MIVGSVSPPPAGGTPPVALAECAPLPVFEDSRKTHVLFAQLASIGSDEARLGEALEERLRVIGRDRGFEVQRAPCLVASHEEARGIGKRAGSDIVLWGEVSSYTGPASGAYRLRMTTTRHTAVETDGGPESIKVPAVPALLDWGMDTILQGDAAQFSHLIIGINEHVNGRPSAALENLRLALSANVDWEQALIANLFAADDAIALGQLDEAGRYVAALGGLCKPGDDRCGGYATLLRGRLQLALGDAAGATDTFSRAASTFSSLSCPPSPRWCGESDRAYLGTSLLYGAFSRAQVGAWPEAVSDYESAEALLRGPGSSEARATALTALSVLANQAGDCAASVEYSERAVGLYGTNDIGQVPGYMLVNLGLAYTCLEPRGVAEPLLRAALSDFGAAPELALEELHAMTNLAELLVQQGRFSEGVDMAYDAMALAEDLGDARGLASAQHTLGRAMDQATDYGAAVDWHGRAIATSNGIGFSWMEVLARRDRAFAFANWGDAGAASDEFRSLFATCTGIGDRRCMAWSRIYAVQFALYDLRTLDELQALSADVGGPANTTLLELAWRARDGQYE